MTPTPPMLTTPQVAARLAKSHRTIHRAVADGKLVPSQQLPGPNGAFLFTEAAVARYAASLEIRVAA